MLLEFQNKANIKIIGFFGFPLDSSDIDKHLDLLDTNIPSNHFAILQDVFITSSRHGFKTPSRHVFKACLQDVIKTSSA